MPNLKIVPASALMTAGQAITFQAIDDQDKPVRVSWALTPQLGNLVTSTLGQAGQSPAPGVQPQQEGQSATYIAPAIVQAAQIVAVTATSEDDAASGSISLTTEAISIIPSAVTLHGGQKQRFVAIVASEPSSPEEIEWVLSPEVGTLDREGLYTAPDLI